MPRHPDDSPLLPGWDVLVLSSTGVAGVVETRLPVEWAWWYWSTTDVTQLAYRWGSTVTPTVESTVGPAVVLPARPHPGKGLYLRFIAPIGTSIFIHGIPYSTLLL